MRGGRRCPLYGRKCTTKLAGTLTWATSSYLFNKLNWSFDKYKNKITAIPQCTEPQRFAAVSGLQRRNVGTIFLHPGQLRPIDKYLNGN
ncbi:hypothetical protein EVAR_82307_1 [Eumeta japonica]|uniref:Uncharacterized protein n=1 Tax=Eumeta variegata TaxID=151549 RepID=A0A4C1W139_EUMVA|nr:hypothetical protein EVAR_82307_1 [Eumeta japonica]